MSTASTSSVLNHGSTAGYNAWVTEVIAALFTSLGLTQTADTGQTTNGGGSVPSTNTAGGYVVGRFNDTAQSTSAIYFKIEFGTGGSSTAPMMWITVGQGSNGSGTITGTLSARTPMCISTAPSSTTTSYVSRFCYNATAGIFWFGWKYNSNTQLNSTSGGLSLFRDNNAAGASTTNSVTLITNQSTTSAGSTTSIGAVQTYSYLTSAWLTLPSSGINTAVWAVWPYGLTTTTYSGQVQVVPCFFCTPVLYVSANLAIGLVNEIPLGNTVSMALVGSTSNTYLSAGNPWGNNAAADPIGGAVGTTSAPLTCMHLWQ
jgi:hypothetical protein